MKFVGKETRIEGNAKEVLEKAIRERKPVGLWLDQHGRQVTFTFARSGDSDNDAISLHEEMNVLSFPICVAVRGRLLDNDGDPISLDDLPRTIEAAEDKRTRFYTEGEMEFGRSAWPGSDR
jgi:hypothetical protein